MQIRRVRPGDEEALRALRLRALEDTPTAFGASLADERAQGEERWISWAARAADGPEHATYVGFDETGWRGMAGGFVMDDEPDAAMLYAMWVEPNARGTALAADLVGTVITWAHTTDRQRLLLWVTETNARARRFYERCGFSLIDGTMPLRSHQEHTLLRMAITLR